MLGDKLRALRRGKAISLEMMQEMTMIQRKYLVALERGIYSELPEPIYTRNFIRAYTRVLDADETYFLELYAGECGTCDLVAPSMTPRQRVRKIKLFVWNQLVAILSIVFVGVTVFIYLGWQIFLITDAPTLTVFSPADEMLTKEAIIVVEGHVDDESTIYVNGKQVVLYDDKTFLTEVDLERGLNIITIEAERRYSRTAHIERSVVFNPPVREFGPLLSTSPSIEN